MLKAARLYVKIISFPMGTSQCLRADASDQRCRGLDMMRRTSLQPPLSPRSRSLRGQRNGVEKGYSAVINAHGADVALEAIASSSLPLLHLVGGWRSLSSNVNCRIKG